jgi:hypothetical protein
MEGSATPRGLSAQPGRPAAATLPASGSIRLGGWLMVAGGALVLGSAFLPRLTAEGPGGTATSGGIRGAGIGMLVLAALAIARGVQVIRPDVLRNRLSSPLVTGAFLVVVVGLRYVALRSEMERLENLPGVTVSIGTGFWLSVLGSALVLLGGALIRSGDGAH